MILRPPRIEGDICFIPLTKGLTAVVDIEDADLGLLNWYAAKGGLTWYAYRNASKRPHVTALLHREIAKRMGLEIDGNEVDHIDMNGLNCRRNNLRAATHSQNKFNCPKRRDNTSGHKGVTWNKQAGKWQSQIKANGVYRRFGLFDDLELAAFVYQEAALRLHGTFARIL